MGAFSTIPGWPALHPSLSHFPIVLLLLAPVFVLLGLALSPVRRGLLLAGLWLLLAGTLATYLAAASGDAARDVAPQTREVKAAVARHEDLGGLVRVAASGLTALWAALLFGPGLLGRSLSLSAFRRLAIAFLLLCLMTAGLVVAAAHTGGLLVHRLGVHAAL